MYRIVIGFLRVMLFSVLACVSVWAQATAQISGTARDQSGAVLPGVEVTATQTDTGIARNAVTNETGFFLLPNLALGSYRLEAALPGFRTYTQTGIVLQVNGSPVINPVLEVGQVSEQIEVQANAALVETRTSVVGQVVGNERILELPRSGSRVPRLPPDLTVRRLAVTRFPYHVVYLETDAQLRILAIAHDRRRPGYWKARLK